MLEVPIIAMKDKQAFSLKPIKRYLGNCVEVCKKLSQKYTLIHIIDEDGLRGDLRNYDVYDKLTYFVHVQTEVKAEKTLLEKLVEINVRVVIPPSITPWDKRFFVAKIKKSDEAPLYRDVLITDLEESIPPKFKNQRVMAFKKIKGVWAWLFYI